MPGDQKAEPGFDDALKVLLAEAGGAIDERAKLLATIAQGQTTLTEAQQELSAAKKRQVAEEYEAAQTEGGLAIATAATERAVADAALKVKSAQLRLKGLETGRARTDAALLEAWRRIEGWRNQFVEARVAEVQAEFGAAISGFFSLLCRVKALSLHHAIQHFNASQTYIMDPTRMSGPSVSGSGGGVCLRIEKENHWLENCWSEDGSASDLDMTLRSIEAQIASVGECVKGMRA